MKRRFLNPLPAPPMLKPQGFTLLELLVVIGIIVFLVSMTVAVVGSALTTAKDKNTKATIKAIDSLLTARMDAFTIALKVQNLTKGDFGTVMRVKNLYKGAFPQTLMEAFGDKTETAGDAAASSEALYEFLINGETFGAPPVGEDAFKGEQIGDTDGDGRKEFLDGWGQPLRFYRWPTRLIRPAPSGQESTAQSYDDTTTPPDYVFKATGDFNPANQSGYTAALFFGSLPAGPELQKDPQDPQGAIHLLFKTNTASFTVAQFERDYHTPETWSLPLILSAGPDGVLGLYEPNDKANNGHLAQPITSDNTQLEGVLDNISNRRLVP